MSGDGLIGQIGGVLAGGEAPLGVIPGGRGNDFARVLGIPTEIAGAGRPARGGRRAAIDVGEVNGRRFLVHRELRVRLRRQPDRQRDARGEGQPRLPLRGAAGPGGVEAGALRGHASTASGSEFIGYAVAAANSKAYGGGMYLAPDAELDDGKLDVV